MLETPSITLLFNFLILTLGLEYGIIGHWTMGSTRIPANLIRSMAAYEHDTQKNILKDSLGPVRLTSIKIPTSTKIHNCEVECRRYTKRSRLKHRRRLAFIIMFGTLRYNIEYNDTESTQQDARPVLEQQNRPRCLACNRCRSRKVHLNSGAVDHRDAG